jgi:transposase
MSKPIVLMPEKWETLKEHLLTQYPRSYIILSWKCKEKLGFTVREHSEWVSSKDLPDCRKVLGRYVNTIRLDFYNDSVQTMFRLRYSDYLQSTPSNVVYTLDW